MMLKCIVVLGFFAQSVFGAAEEYLGIREEHYRSKPGRQRGYMYRGLDWAFHLMQSQFDFVLDESEFPPEQQKKVLDISSRYAEAGSIHAIIDWSMTKLWQFHIHGSTERFERFQQIVQHFDHLISRVYTDKTAGTSAHWKPKGGDKVLAALKDIYNELKNPRSVVELPWKFKYAIYFQNDKVTLFDVDDGVQPIDGYFRAKYDHLLGDNVIRCHEEVHIKDYLRELKQFFLEEAQEQNGATITFDNLAAIFSSDWQNSWSHEKVSEKKAGEKLRQYQYYTKLLEKMGIETFEFGHTECDLIDKSLEPSFQNTINWIKDDNKWYEIEQKVYSSLGANEANQAYQAGLIKKCKFAKYSTGAKCMCYPRHREPFQCRIVGIKEIELPEIIYVVKDNEGRTESVKEEFLSD